MANLSTRDLAFISRLMEASGFAARSQHRPVLRRMVSANLSSERSDFASPQKFIVREIAPRDKNSKPFRVAFIGLTETDPAPPFGFKAADPIEAARLIVPEARKKADFVVALAKMKTEMAVKLARDVAGIDALIAGNNQINDAPFTLPLKIRGTLVAFTPLETRMLGELRVYRDAKGKFSSRARFITLDPGVPEDPEASEFAKSTERAERDSRKEARAFLDNWLASVQANKRLTTGKGQLPGGFISSVGCAACHAAHYIQWVNTRHYRSMDSVMLKVTEFDQSCIACHGSVTEKQGDRPKFAAVECEQCHGPGAEHAARPAKGYGRISDLKTVCSSCHTEKTSPAFDAQAAWMKIKH
ncbi:MAG: multiheme c-type cytochrome [Acidobacteriota bacterium]